MLHFVAKILILILLIFVYCEFLIYYFVLLGCSWSQLSKFDQDPSVKPPSDPNRKPLHVMIVTDTHLLGSSEGHWFNKLRREWQMYRSFHSALFLFEPHVIFFLGDLTNSGQQHSDDEWTKSIERFRALFSVSPHIGLHVLAGNHDIGFHFEVTDKTLKRFEQSFQTPHVRLLTVKDDHVHFVLINSMAFEGDQCRLCERADRELNGVIAELNRTDISTRPVLLSHFPLYRSSDANCSHRSSTFKSNMQYPPHKERYNVLSQEATEHLLKTIKPRLAFSGHTHSLCYTQHQTSDGRIIPEWTVPSFSWHNRDDPSFMLLLITTNNHRVSHCYLPRETTIIWLYVIGCFLILFYILFGGRRPLYFVIFCFFKNTFKK